MADLLSLLFHAPWLFLLLLLPFWLWSEIYVADKKKELEDKAKEKEIRDFIS